MRIRNKLDQQKLLEDRQQTKTINKNEMEIENYKFEKVLLRCILGVF